MADEIREAVNDINAKFEDWLQKVAPVNMKGKHVCPLCGSGTKKKHTSALEVYKGRNGSTRAHCFACGADGDAVEFISMYHNVHGNFVEKVRAAADAVGGIVIQEHEPLQRLDMDNREERDYTEKLKRAVYMYKQRSDRMTGGNYLRDRGISDEVANRFGIGFDPWYHFKDPEQGLTQAPAIIIPTSKYSYAARITDGSKSIKYHKKGSPRIFAPRNLTAPVVMVVEGEIDAMSIMEVGYPAVAIGSVSNYRKLLYAIDELDKKPFVIVAMDPDPAGENAACKIMEGLKNMGVHGMKAGAGYLQGRHDPNDLLVDDREALKKSVAEKFATASEIVANLPKE